MKLSATHAFNCIVLRVKFGLTSCEDIPPALICKLGQGLFDLVLPHNVEVCWWKSLTNSQDFVKVFHTELFSHNVSSMKLTIHVDLICQSIFPSNFALYSTVIIGIWMLGILHHKIKFVTRSSVTTKV